MWCNNAIICTVLRINRRYFSSKKDSAENFNAYMQEVDLKFYNFPLILLTFLFWARCMHRKFQLQDLCGCALAWWCVLQYIDVLSSLSVQSAISNDITSAVCCRQWGHSISLLRLLTSQCLWTFASSKIVLHGSHSCCTSTQRPRVIVGRSEVTVLCILKSLSSISANGNTKWKNCQTYLYGTK